MPHLTPGDYLRHIGYHGPSTPTPALLRALVTAHLTTVPFENLDMLRQIPLSLERETLWDKIITRRRGGICHELNNALRYLLEDLGFAVRLRSARIDSVDSEMDHTTLRVQCDGAPWLVDVGCGKYSYPPLRLDSREIQPGFSADYLLRDESDGTLTLLHRGRGETDFSFFYALYPPDREKEDFLPAYQAAAVPGATPFSTHYMCARLDGNTRYCLCGNTLTIERDGVPRQLIAEDEDHARAMVRDYFHIAL